jgi:putative nucleotidyltransferase with HDIG domain
MTEKLQRQHLASVRALASAIDARDPYTRGHSARVGQLAVMLGRQMGMDEKTLSQIEIGGYLHDIGKIGIRDAILLKEDDLTIDERGAISEHTSIGLAILEPVELAEEIMDFVRSHHERLDGSGYPRGLKGEEVSMIARIAAVADMYDALTSGRPYRVAATSQEALALLRSEAGDLLDASVVEALASILPEWEQRRTSEPYLDGATSSHFEPAQVLL